jgi:predicted metalloendopeptidase
MMMDYLMKSFKERVNQMDWLSDFSKQRSIEKLYAITLHSAYPAEFLDYDYDDYDYINYQYVSGSVAYVQGFYSRVSKN